MINRFIQSHIEIIIKFRGKLQNMRVAKSKYCDK